ncbi:hypothetical protein [Thalassobellus suaedae]|uniref:Uncharacterized protein n=1 Tax=Thalassobellus suaedae TaxID=3074124 RepID=A0ABY9XX07_9FLAO|nr:hypothetical protein RHP51_07530 [Flavobacteriaceae bacterium HL-DH14]
MNYNPSKTIESLINEVAEKGIVSKAQLYKDLKTLTDDFNETTLRFINDDVNNLIKNLEYKYKPLDWKKPFTVVAPKVYMNQMELIKRQLSNLQELSQFISEEQTKIESSNNTINREFKFSNNFDQIEATKVYECFYKLVERGYLLKEDLESYLILAFQDKTQPKEKFTFSNKHIGNITAIFYKYYTEVDSPHGKQKQYAELLGEYFKGFTTQRVINNFAKSK